MFDDLDPVDGMKKGRTKSLLQRATSMALPDASKAVMEHVDGLTKMSIDQIEAAMRTEAGMRKLRGPLARAASDATHLPAISEVVEAVPGAMTDEEFARILSGGVRQGSGPAPRRKRT